VPRSTLARRGNGLGGWRWCSQVIVLHLNNQFGFVGRKGLTLDSLSRKRH